MCTVHSTVLAILAFSYAHIMCTVAVIRATCGACAIDLGLTKLHCHARLLGSAETVRYIVPDAYDMPVATDVIAKGSTGSDLQEVHSHSTMPI
jgi:hypothetical protein